jgi:isocitrate dehydrogenase
MPTPITMSAHRLNVPNDPIIPFIEGDGTGPDIWRASVRVIDAAVAKASNGKKQIHWHEVLAGEKAFNKTGNWLPDQTIEDFKKYLVGIKGPLTTPVGGGIRSLNVALRQLLDLYVCLRPVRWFQGVPSPVKKPGDCDMVIFRENTEDIYAGIEWSAGSPEAAKFLAFMEKEFPKEFKKIRFGTAAAGQSWGASIGHPDMYATPAVGVGIKPVSRAGSERLIWSAIEYALKNKRKSLTLVHKGQLVAPVLERALGELHDVALVDERQRLALVLQGILDRGHHAPAGAHAPQGLRCHRHHEPQRRLPLRRSRGPDRRHRHRPGREH